MCCTAVLGLGLGPIAIAAWMTVFLPSLAAAPALACGDYVGPGAPRRHPPISPCGIFDEATDAHATT
eukprot:11460349-Prorocentrum_lima.AAC.1